MIIIREVEQIVSLKIGFIGYNSQLTQDGLRQFTENNEEDVEIFKYRKSYIRLKDGTEIVGLYENRRDGLRGHRLDQIILFDDERWMIKLRRCEFIKQIIERCLNKYSCVPEEFQILEYEDTRCKIGLKRYFANEMCLSIAGNRALYKGADYNVYKGFLD